MADNHGTSAARSTFSIAVAAMVISMIAILLSVTAVQYPALARWYEARSARVLQEARGPRADRALRQWADARELEITVTIGAHAPWEYVLLGFGRPRFMCHATVSQSGSASAYADGAEDACEAVLHKLDRFASYPLTDRIIN